VDVPVAVAPPAPDDVAPPAPLPVVPPSGEQVPAPPPDPLPPPSTQAPRFMQSTFQSQVLTARPLQQVGFPIVSGTFKIFVSDDALRFASRAYATY
jgi:hypothetical protein